MGVGITLAMSIAGADLRDEFIESKKQIVYHVGIGVFVNGYGCGCVRYKDYDYAVVNSAMSNGLVDLFSYIDKFITLFGLYVNRLHGSSPGD